MKIIEVIKDPFDRTRTRERDPAFISKMNQLKLELSRELRDMGQNAFYGIFLGILKSLGLTFGRGLKAAFSDKYSTIDVFNDMLKDVSKKNGIAESSWGVLMNLFRLAYKINRLGLGKTFKI